MNEQQDKPTRKPKRFKSFSLSFLLIFITVVALLTIYVNYRRERGNDVLHETLKGIASADGLGNSDEKPTWMDRLLGNSNPQQIGNIVSFDSYLRDHAATIDRQTASRLAKNFNTSAIDELRFVRMTVDTDAVCFFENWQQVKRLQIRDTTLPKPWLEGIARMSGLKELVISGGLCNLEPETLVDCPSLEKLTLCHRNVNSARLYKLSQSLPAVKILLLGSADQEYPYPANSVTLSTHNPQAYSKLKASLDGLKQTLGSLEPPAKNRFNPPATESQILQYEQRTGFPLHSFVRALFELHNGQPSGIDELILFEKLLSIDESIGNMDIEMDAADGVLDNMYNFMPDYDWMDNPNLIGIGSSEADVLYVNNVTGKVYHSYEGLYYVFPTLAEYFDAITEEVQAGRFERNKHDCICLTDITTAIAKSWRKRQQESKPLR